MAVYKVPQNVEADDKLIGPFSFRQFIYLIIVVLAGVAAWGLAQLFIGLVIIPLPIIVFFGALALPLRKDQPMEVYLAAIVSFQLKPRKRLWDPDGADSLIQITAPRTVAPTLTKTISQADAEQRIQYLASLVDSGGWAIRGVNGPQDSPMNSEAFYEAQTATDVLDTSNSVGQSFDTLMAQRTEQIKEEAMERMHMPIPQATSAPNETNPFLQPQGGSTSLVYDPYPTDIQQTVIQPVGDDYHQYQSHLRNTPEPVPAPLPPPPLPIPTAPVMPPPYVPAVPLPEPVQTTTSSNPISPDIMNLANNTDLSIETIAHEAQRIHEKEDAEPDEVVIRLR